MKKYIFMALTAMMAVSCVDTIILPDDRTVEEDFWKKKADVQLMVNGAYKSMVTEAVLTRLIVWGSLRSEELIPVTSISGGVQEDLTEINLGNTQSDNQFVTWSPFYSVINNCNLVLDKAEKVMSEDPSYTEGDYKADCSQMLALRALCYFYLVRNFRDVPLITTAFTTSSQNRNIPQATPDSVLNRCIDDLKTAEQNSILATAYNDWRRVGYFTRDAIQALLADIYLWRASVTHNTADYEQAIAYCDKVIASKKSQHRLGFGETEMPEYPLAEGRDAFNDLYIEGNAEESIFELQFDGSANQNTAIGKYYNHYNERDATQPFFYAAEIFGWEKSGGVYYNVDGRGTNADWRGASNTYSTEVSSGDMSGRLIRKYVANNVLYSQTAASVQETKSVGYTPSLNKNFIIYRLSDIMLMKAEALVAIAADDSDEEHLREAFALFYEVNTRSHETKTQTAAWNTYNTIEKLEAAIMEERLRELAFEGKRWYDLLRFHYRHSTGVRYDATLFQLSEEGVAEVPSYTPMLDLMKRKLDTKGNAVAAKLSTESRLYLPISLSELSVSPALNQNPGYSDAQDYEKN